MTAVARLAHTVTSGALGYLHANRQFGAFEDEVNSDLNDPDGVYKPLCELALAASLVLRDGVTGTAEQQAARELLDFTWGQLRRGDLLYERQLRHPVLTDPLEVYSHHARSGYHHPALARTIDVGAAEDSMTEVLPNRRMAVANAHRVVGVPRDDDFEAMLRQTWLGRTPQPWVVDWYTAYHMTHAAFHITDWGGRPADMPADVAAYLETWLPVWFDVWAEAGQWDLVGELLIVSACLPEPRFVESEWELFAGLQHAEGFVPRDAEPVDDDPRLIYQNHQHTAVVAAIAGTVALSRLLGGGG
ncbi:hypothetical protein AB0I60_14590 [Actinosynnema sp. NPDC050436]|uniref:DUF6895 family protein n=1 Tax=Actinosynnema sp. NPDC050436 TaxID=3155659 RepID=UPI0033DD8308